MKIIYINTINNVSNVSNGSSYNTQKCNNCRELVNLSSCIPDYTLISQQRLTNNQIVIYGYHTNEHYQQYQ